MKKLVKNLPLVLSFGVGLWSTGVMAEERPWEVRLPFETAIIHYEITGSQKGKETLYIRDHGNEHVKVTKSKTKIMFVTTKTDTITITTRGKVITVNMEDKTGVKMTNPNAIFEQEYSKLSAKEKKIVKENIEKTGMNLSAAVGAEVMLKGDNHLGYDCDVVKVMGTTSCNIAGSSILLKMESSMMGMGSSTIAKKIEENVAIPENIFRVPEGVKVIESREQEEMARGMVQTMLAMMKDPDAERKMAEGMREAREAQFEDAQQSGADVEENDSSDNESGSASSDMPDQKKVQEAMEKGMDMIKGLFGK
ncbi:MAG: hypothetical protein ACE5EH_08080 [Gammaproteobacteria bacterium]